MRLISSSADEFAILKTVSCISLFSSHTTIAELFSSSVATIHGAHSIKVLANTSTATDVVLDSLLVLVAASLGAEAASDHAHDVQLNETGRGHFQDDARID